jgi:uncharacterized membrane protein YdjX (TVP38/TMEM64 family)
LIQAALGLAVLALLLLAFRYNDGFRLEGQRAIAIVASGDAAAIGAYLRSFGPWAPIASLGLMVLQAVWAPVPAFLITFANGLAFGVIWGGLLSILGQSIAAVVCFGIARAFGRGPVEALAGRMGFGVADRWFARWGARGVFVTRLVPGISFDLVSYAAGLTGMKFAPFLAATVAGVAPQAMLYVVLIETSPRAAWVVVSVAWLAVVIAAVVFAWRARRPAAPSLPVGPGAEESDRGEVTAESGRPPAARDDRERAAPVGAQPWADGVGRLS